MRGLQQLLFNAAIIPFRGVQFFVNLGQIKRKYAFAGQS